MDEAERKAREHMAAIDVGHIQSRLTRAESDISGLRTDLNGIRAAVGTVSNDQSTTIARVRKVEESQLAAKRSFEEFVREHVDHTGRVITELAKVGGRFDRQDKRLSSQDSELATIRVDVERMCLSVGEHGPKLDLLISDREESATFQRWQREQVEERNRRNAERWEMAKRWLTIAALVSGLIASMWGAFWVLMAHVR